MGEIRRSGMKKRIENEMKERGEEGEVDIDSIDWLTGSYKLKSDVDGQTEEEDIPVITGKTSEDEEGIFSTKSKLFLHKISVCMLTIVNTKYGGHVISQSEKRRNILFLFIMHTPPAK